MNIDDLRVVLGSDDLYRRNFSIKVEGETISLLFEARINDTWENSSDVFDEKLIYSKITCYNIRKCLLFSAYRKSKETSLTVKVYSGQVV